MWRCDRCGKVFQHYLHVAQHRHSHTRTRPYKCSFEHCLKVFHNFSELQKHHRVHLDQRRYYCGQCGVHFLQKAHLRHHACQQNVPRVYKCHICSATFFRILSLANHLHVQHPRYRKAQQLGQRNVRERQKRNKRKIFKASVENADDSKILLKIFSGKSMTILSPSKLSSEKSEKKNSKRKLKKKHKKEDERPQRQGIILSIKKGMVNVTDKRKEINQSKQKQSERKSSMSSTDYKVGEKKSELKLTIKACPDLNKLKKVKGENYKVLERSDSQSSLKLEKRTSSRIEIDKMESIETDGVLKDQNESKVRNGVVITKDKSGKFLAEQLAAVKSKKRDNVFESFNDVGLWKVLASPRDRPNDILKLKLSPQKPAKIESTIEEACAFSAAKYLDIPVDSSKLKGEVSGEDSDILELLPSYDKETDGGMSNVNDSGIEVLSSSSCNRSNGNSVRSVINEDNSPTYFNTEDSVFSLDSPDIVNKSEHSICHKCGGIIMETNNNAQSPGHCRCNLSDPISSFPLLESPIKTNLVSPEKQTKAGNSHNNQKLIDLDNEKSDGEDSDIMIITFDKPQTGNSEEGRSKLKLKLKSKDPSKSPFKGVKDKSVSPLKGNGVKSLSPHKGNKAESGRADSDKASKSSSSVSEISSVKTEGTIANQLLVDSNRNNQIVTRVKEQTHDIGKPQTKSDILIINGDKHNDSQDGKLDSASDATAVIVIEDNDDNKTYSKEQAVQRSESKQEKIESSTQIRKKPLFKTKKSVSQVTTNSVAEANVEKQCITGKDNTVQNKKPLFKKRTLSADGNNLNTAVSAKKLCLKTQMSVPSSGFTDRDDKVSNTQHESKENNSVEEIAIGRKTVPGKKSVGRLTTIGVEEEDSLQQFSSEIIAECEKTDTQVEQDKNPATSFDLYQQQFLSFLSNTVSSSESNNSQDKKSDIKQNEEEEKSEEIENTTSKSLEGDTNTIENISKVNDESVEIQSEQKTVESEGCKFERYPENTKDEEPKNIKVTSKRVKNKIVKVTRNANGNKTKVRCSTLRISNVKSSGDTEKDKAKKETRGKAKKNDTIEKEHITDIEKKVTDSEVEDVKSSRDTRKELSATDQGKDESLKHKPLASATSALENDSKSKVKNTSDPSIVDGTMKTNTMTGGEKVVKVVKSDSLSWLSIFSEKVATESDQNKKESSADVMTDLSENLAEINKKIDVSEEDDSHSLDVDDVFQMDNLSSLEPKPEISFCNSQINISKGSTVNSEVKSGPPYKRKQTAKRTGGKFKVAKKKVESEAEYPSESSGAETVDLISSHADSDPDFNPFMDSDDDFVKAPPKRRDSRTCVRSKRSHVTGSESSDSCGSDTERLDSESQSSRSRRSKMGRKSCCPCCIGSPRKKSRDHGGDQDSSAPRETYKLPRKHKQFVRSTLKLLQLQEKIHTLFLTLFPECAEIISKSNVGTEEFESLIDDVLNGLEEKDPEYSQTLHPISYMKQNLAEGEFGSCPVNNIEMPFTAPGSATRTSEIDLVNTSGEENGCHSVVQGREQVSQNDLHSKTAYTLDNKQNKNTAGKDTGAGISWQQATLFSQTSLIAPPPSSSSLKFENNTITGSDDMAEENTLENVPSCSPVDSEPSLSFAQVSVARTLTSPYHLENSEDMINVGSAAHLGLLEQPDSLSNMEYYPQDISSLPVVQSEITITLDLNAIRVSLCRSPKQCLEKLQNQIIKLSKCFLPKLEFKNYFYRNIDNLEFLLDLMINANSGDRLNDGGSESDVVEETISEKWHLPSNNLELIEAPIIKEDDTVKVNFFSSKSDTKTEEREPLFVKCSDLFEQEIKNQRESLKKDVFNVEEDPPEDTWKSAEEVLCSIKSLKKMAKRTEMAQRARRPRESRLRKRSADEKRTLFVREKLQNSQNSTFVCDTRTRSGNKFNSRKKRSSPVNSKKRFLSELNLGDKLVGDNKGDKLLEECIKDKMNGHVVVIKTRTDKTNPDSEEVLLRNSLPKKADKTVLNEQSKMDSSTEEIGDTDFLHKGDKNIFELMQPS